MILWLDSPNIQIIPHSNSTYPNLPLQYNICFTIPSTDQISTSSIKKVLVRNEPVTFKSESHVSTIGPPLQRLYFPFFPFFMCF